MTTEEKTVEERVAQCREALQGDGSDPGDGVPKWVPTQWVNAITYRLGMAAYHAQRFEEALQHVVLPGAVDNLEEMVHDLTVVAAVSMDAVAALAQLRDDSTEKGVRAAVAEARGSIDG